MTPGHHESIIILSKRIAKLFVRWRHTFPDAAAEPIQREVLALELTMQSLANTAAMQFTTIFERSLILNLRRETQSLIRGLGDIRRWRDAVRSVEKLPTVERWP